MWQKIYFLVALVFFLAMNILLWRSQYGQEELALPLPVETVTRRLFSAADDSNLNILHRGAKIGYCRWSPQTLSVIPNRSGSRSAVPDGMISGITGYSMSLDGTVLLKEIDHLRFNVAVELDTNFVWRSFRLRLSLSDWRLEAASIAEENTLQINLNHGDASQRKVYSMDELRDPASLFRRLGGGFLSQLWPITEMADTDTLSREIALGLDWVAYADREKLGDTTFPVYRLQTELLGDYRLRLFVLPSGELLRIALPDEFVLINEKLTGM